TSSNQTSKKSPVSRASIPAFAGREKAPKRQGMFLILPQVQPLQFDSAASAPLSFASMGVFWVALGCAYLSLAYLPGSLQITATVTLVFGTAVRIPGALREIAFNLSPPAAPKN